MKSLFSFIINLTLFSLITSLMSCSLSAEQKPSLTIGEKRIELVADKVKAIGCIMDKKAIIAAKDGEVVILKHKTNPKGDCKIEFNSMKLPKGNWIVYAAKNSLQGESFDVPPKQAPNSMYAVSAILTGLEINTTPRSLDSDRKASMVYLNIERLSGWDIKIAHNLSSHSRTRSFSYRVPANSVVTTKKFKRGQLPIINRVHRNAKGKFLASAIYWFEEANVKN